MSLATIWVVPYLSRMSRKMIFPCSRMLLTQPARVVVLFACVSRSSPHVCVLNMFFYCWEGLLSFWIFVINGGRNC